MRHNQKISLKKETIMYVYDLSLTSAWYTYYTPLTRYNFWAKEFHCSTHHIEEFTSPCFMEIHFIKQRTWILVHISSDINTVALLWTQKVHNTTKRNENNSQNKSKLHKRKQINSSKKQLDIHSQALKRRMHHHELSWDGILQQYIQINCFDQLKDLIAFKVRRTMGFNNDTKLSNLN